MLQIRVVWGLSSHSVKCSKSATKVELDKADLRRLGKL